MPPISTPFARGLAVARGNEGQAPVSRELVRRDLEEAVDYYVREAGEQIALDFIDAVQQAYVDLASHPTAGSPQYAHDLNLPGLRCCRLKRFPYLIFYLELDDQIDIWRMLHSHRDIATWMQDPGD
jgi:toxin ParE1/3/4